MNFSKMPRAQRVIVVANFLTLFSGLLVAVANLIDFAEQTKGRSVSSQQLTTEFADADSL